MLISLGSQSPLRNIHSCTEPSGIVVFLHTQLMFSHQLIDWVEDATSAISILIEQNDMWACYVGDYVTVAFLIYKAG